MNQSNTTVNTARRPIPAGAGRTGPRPRMNLGILIIIVVLVCYGLLILFSASMTEGYASEGDPTFYVVKQAGITIVGVLAMIVLSYFPIRIFDRLWLVVAVYAVITILLLLLHLPIPFAKTLNGATRWLEIGPLPRFQPSELAKIGLVFCFAGYTSWLRRRKEAGKDRSSNGVIGFFREGFIQFIVPGMAILAWIALIVTQPHLSCAIIMACLAACCYFAAGFRARVWAAGILILLIVIIVIALVVAFFVVPLLPDGYLDQYAYWGRRVDVFTGSDEASKDDRHQSEQSMIAIGSGGLTGVGLGQGVQKYNYLPEEFNDYVFAILAEELGLIGSLSVILLFLLLLVMGMSAALRTIGPFPTVIVFGYTCLLCMQAFLNIGVATGVLPPTGISLPLFSYGGTSNLFFLLGVGLLLSASRSGNSEAQARRAAHA